MYQETPPTPDKGRLIALRSGFGQLGLTAGLVVGGALGEGLGIKRLFVVAGVATIVIGLIIYLPYRSGAGRRARTAWAAAVATGAKRTVALQRAREAAWTGVVLSGPAAAGAAGAGAAAAAWAAAADEAAPLVPGPPARSVEPPARPVEAE
jgi:hypothetical protein